MSFTQGRHWSHRVISDDARELAIFDMIGFKKGAQAFLGYHRESLFESNCESINAMISQVLARLQDERGDLSSIRLNSHTALLLFFENVLTAKVLAAAVEDEHSITTRLFNVPVIIQKNPEFAIAYLDASGAPVMV